MTLRSLNYYLGLDNYFPEAFTVEKIRTILMARGEILPLSYIPNVTASNTVCPICSMGEQENVVHFIGCCPILREIRLLHFGKAQLQCGMYSIRWMGNVGQLSTATSTRL